MKKVQIHNFEDFLNENEKSEFVALCESIVTMLNESENAEEGPLADLADLISDNASEIEADVDRKLEEIEPEIAAKVMKKMEDAGVTPELDESLGVMAAIGGALSFGKLTELTGKIPRWFLKKMDPERNKAASKVAGNIFDWLVEKGENYTHGIEKGIEKLLINKIPWVKDLPDGTKHKISKWTLTLVILGMAGVSAKGTWDAFHHGDDVTAGVEGLLTGVKSTEVAQNVGNAIVSAEEVLVDSASIVSDLADAGDEIVDVISDTAEEAGDDQSA